VRLNKYERNAVYEALVAGRLEPSECDLDSDAKEARVNHVASASKFAFGSTGITYSGSEHVGDSSRSARFTDVSWGIVLVRLRRWAEEVVHYVDTPDLWSSLLRGYGVLANSRYAMSTNTVFAADEQALIAETLREVKDYVKQAYSLTSGQFSKIDEKIDEAISAADRMGRKDWLLLFAGVVLTLIVTDLVPPHVVQQFFMLTLQGLGHLFGHDQAAPRLKP